MVGMRYGLSPLSWLHSEWAWNARVTLDRYVSSSLVEPTVLCALSGSGLHAGRRAQQLGELHICDRGSFHIRVQDEFLYEEYRRYGAD